MFELTVQREFRAAHAISMQGQREQTHDHCWQVSVVVQGDSLDDDGLLCDFHLIERELEDVIGCLRDRDLNRTPPFDQINPTAEQVARHIGEQLAGVMPPGVVLRSVSVTEAPGCVARWRK
jgi:6-pyruvoyltetrahydropterin/6-carboxytetrahydropterin synthase